MGRDRGAHEGGATVERVAADAGDRTRQAAQSVAQRGAVERDELGPREAEVKRVLRFVEREVPGEALAVPRCGVIGDADLDLAHGRVLASRAR